jgi:hypothetical protein
MPDEVHVGDEPMSRLTAVANEALEAIETHELSQPNDRVLVLLFEDVDEGVRGGIAMHGYDDPTQAALDLFLHLSALFEANGQQLTLLPIAREQQSREQN